MCVYNLLVCFILNNGRQEGEILFRNFKKKKHVSEFFLKCFA